MKSDMFNSGVCAFNSWAGNGREFWERFLGAFDPKMTAEKADEILHEDKITPEGKAAFRRGWTQAQSEFTA